VFSGEKIIGRRRRFREVHLNQREKSREGECFNPGVRGWVLHGEDDIKNADGHEGFWNKGQKKQQVEISAAGITDEAKERSPSITSEFRITHFLRSKDKHPERRWEEAEYQRKNTYYYKKK